MSSQRLVRCIDPEDFCIAARILVLLYDKNVTKGTVPLVTFSRENVTMGTVPFVTLNNTLRSIG